jgi:hypothetical protein
LVEIGSVVSEEKIFLNFIPPFFLAGMVPGWVPFKTVSDSPALHSRWPLLLKIEISSNGQNCSILSQNVPKFELYKHNFELGGHLGWKSGSPDIILEGDHPRIISAKFG